MRDMATIVPRFSISLTFRSNVPSNAATITTLPASAASRQNSTSCNIQRDRHVVNAHSSNGITIVCPNQDETHAHLGRIVLHRCQSHRRWPNTCALLPAAPRAWRQTATCHASTVFYENERKKASPPHEVRFTVGRTIGPPLVQPQAYGTHSLEYRVSFLYLITRHCSCAWWKRRMRRMSSVLLPLNMGPMMS